MDFAIVLRQFEGALGAAGAGVTAALAPGIPEEDVRADLDSLGMEPAQELVEWFAWHNGIASSSSLSVANGPGWPLGRTTAGTGSLGLWWPLSLEESIAEWRAKDRGAEPWQWDPRWLPIGIASARDTLAVRCDPPQGPSATVRNAAVDAGLFNEDEMPSVTGFATVVTWWTESIYHGWWRFDQAHDNWDNTRWAEMPLERRLTGLA